MTKLFSYSRIVTSAAINYVIPLQETLRGHCGYLPFPVPWMQGYLGFMKGYIAAVLTGMFVSIGLPSMLSSSGFIIGEP